MSNVGAVAGTELYIADPGPLSPEPAWVQVNNLFNIGELGTTDSEVQVESIDDGFTRILKGTTSSAAFPVVMNRDFADDGQNAMAAAHEDKTQALYNFKLVLNDQPAGGSSPSIFTFQGKVMGFARSFGGTNDVRRVNSSIAVEPDSIVETVAS